MNKEEVSALTDIELGDLLTLVVEEVRTRELTTESYRRQLKGVARNVRDHALQKFARENT